ncbi:adenosylcobinamide-phosphate synthase CbiB [Roseobacter sp. HKCCA0434]|uniref:adenosylcobinamide-phosphate synthase CbiB n=1 Tax=Roseobacter sp. HKCCA0434 TaxID=3079297 RepID=UPI002905F1A9|nr:adenosylcobinamide-phosphate synthase CbiB [Roseobacter sp. HKCCA0434]
MSAAAVLLAGFLLDAMLGEPRWLWSRVPHPAVLMGRLVGTLDARLNDDTRGRGVLALMVLVLTAGTVGFGLSLLPPLLQVIPVAILLAQRSLAEHVGAVGAALGKGLEQGRRAVSMIVGRDVSRLDEAAVARAAIESGAENLSDGVIAPAFWFLVAGLPGLLIYKAVNTADSMIGHRTPRHARFGWASARLDDVLNLVPARVTALLIAAGSLRHHAFRVAWRDARNHRSPNAGWPEAAMAGALGIRLSGPRRYAEGWTEQPWLNAKGRDAQAVDIEKATALMWRAWGLAVAGVALLALT